MIRFLLRVAAVFALGPSSAVAMPVAGAPTHQNPERPGDPASYPGRCDTRSPMAASDFICLPRGEQVSGVLRQSRGGDRNPHTDAVRFFVGRRECVRLTVVQDEPGARRQGTIIGEWLRKWDSEEGGVQSFEQDVSDAAAGWVAWREWSPDEAGWHQSRLYSNRRDIKLQLGPCQP